VELIVKDVARDKLDDMPQDFDYVFSELVLLGAELLARLIHKSFSQG
jgi:hypothetical protein